MKPQGSLRAFFLTAPIFLATLLVCVVALGPQARLGEPPIQRELDWIQQTSLAELEPELQRREAAISDVKIDLQKKIIWHPAVGFATQAKRVVVFLHGFSASRHEMSPVPEGFAASLGAHFFATRLSGHGGSGEPLRHVQASDWLFDAEEALAIGRRLGRQVILMGNSTGATLAIWLANRHPEAITQLILTAPNFGPRDRRSEILLWPWGLQILHLVQGEYREWQPTNEEMSRYWINRYPARALIEMMLIVDQVRRHGLPNYSGPALFIVSPKDDVVSYEKAAEFYAGLRNPRTQWVDWELTNGHIFAGAIAASEGIQPLLSLLTEKLRHLK